MLIFQHQPTRGLLRNFPRFNELRTKVNPVLPRTRMAGRRGASIVGQRSRGSRRIAVGFNKIIAGDSSCVPRRMGFENDSMGPGGGGGGGGGGDYPGTPLNI